MSASKKKPSRLLPLLAALSCLVCSSAAAAAAAAGGDPDLLDLSIEQLLDLEVTSAARRKQTFSEVAAAMFVITQDDIRRSGARSIPEALRMAPGLHVAQIDANKWAISARGFTGRFANKLLVLMDGRTLYTSSYSGVFWDVQDTLMDNIERIEVIRGPGGSLWGSNAVNGIINIITRDSRYSRDGLVTAGFSDRGAARAALRVGGGDDDLAYTTYLKFSDGQGNRDLEGRDTADDWHQARAGARVDWKRRTTETLTVTGEYYTGKSGETLQLATLPPPYVRRLDDEEDVEGGFVLGRWTRQWTEDQESSLQALVDITQRRTVLFAEKRRTIELEGQQRFRIAGVHDIVVGLGYRHDSFDFASGTDINIRTPSPAHSRLSAFVQDEISLFDGRLRVTAGSKLEHNALSTRDVEFLPNLRASWAIGEGHALWGAATRSVRTPSHGDLAAEISGLGPGATVPPGTVQNPLPLPIRVQLVGNPRFLSETLDAFELGYRGQLAAGLSLDAAVFLNRYSDLRSVTPTGLYCSSTGEPVDPSAPPACLFTSTSLLSRGLFENNMKLESRGAELSVDWRATQAVRLVGTYAYFHAETKSVLGPFDERYVDRDPRHRLSLRSEIALGPGLDLGLWLRYSGRLGSSSLGPRWNADSRLAWRPLDRVEFELVGTNLFHRARLEFLSELNDVVPTAIERSVTASVRWSF